MSLKDSSTQQLPPGFVYIENFLTLEEQKRILDTLDANTWSKEIVRRQQFYGPVYYFTPQALCSSLQPVSDKLNSTIIGENTPEVAQVVESNRNDEIDPSMVKDTFLISDTHHIEQKTDLPHHSLGQLQWVIDKLLAAKLFERADTRNPFVEYIKNDKNQLIRVENQFDIIDPLTTPQGIDELDHAELKRLNKCRKSKTIETIDEQNPTNTKNYQDHTWGDIDFYPDQILVNEYLKQQGIGAHFDDALSFGPQIIGISLGDESTLILSRPQCCENADKELRNAYKTKMHTNIAKNEDIKNSSNSDSNDEIEFSECDGQNIDDIENLGDFFVKFKKIKENKKSSEESYESIHELSYPISLRDYTRNNWKTGTGPEILGKYCRCTRQAMLTKMYPNHKYLLNLPIPLPHHLPESPENLEKYSETFNLEDSLNNSKQSYKASTYWSIKRQAIYDEFKLQNQPISTTPEEINNFVMSFDYYSLPHRTFHPRSGEDTTPPDILEKMNELREQSRADIDKTLIPTLHQFNQCKHPLETIEIKAKPGSVYVLAGQSRYQYRHAIKRGNKTQKDDYRRVSLTIRSLLPGRRQVVVDSKEDWAGSKREHYGVSYLDNTKTEQNE